jgi:hypothetical protein
MALAIEIDLTLEVSTDWREIADRMFLIIPIIDRSSQKFIRIEDTINKSNSSIESAADQRESRGASAAIGAQFSIGSLIANDSKGFLLVMRPIFRTIFIRMRSVNCDLRVQRKGHGTEVKRKRRKKRKGEREKGTKGSGQDSSKTLDIGNVASGLDLSRRSDPVNSGIFNTMNEKLL